MKLIILFSLGIIFLLYSIRLQSQTLDDDKTSFLKNIDISYGLGYMDEWKNDLVWYAGQELSSPNSAFVTWLGLSYLQSKGWLFQTSIDLEAINERDLDEKFFLRSLHFSFGRQVLWAGNYIRFYAGFSSIRHIDFIGRFSRLPDGTIDYDLYKGEINGYLYPHISSEFFSDLGRYLKIGLRVRAISNFNNFGRLDFSGFLSYSF